MRFLPALLAALLAGCDTPPPAPVPAPAPAGPDFSGISWLDGAPDLTGRPVLVRWWTNG